MKVPEVFQVETPSVLGSLARVLNALTETGLVLEHLRTLRSDLDRTLWEITVEIDGSPHAELLGRLNALPAVRFVGWSDRVFDRHRGGKIDYTYLGRAVAIVTDGSAILGLGNIGPRAGLPVIEGKPALFAGLVGISGIPILVESASVDHFVEVVCAIASRRFSMPRGRPVRRCTRSLSVSSA